MDDCIAILTYLMDGETERVRQSRQSADTVDTGIHIARQPSLWAVHLKEVTQNALELGEQPRHVGAFQVRSGLTKMAVVGQARIGQYLRDPVPCGLKFVPDRFELLNVDMAHEARARPPAIPMNVCSSQGFGQSRPDSVRMVHVAGAFRCVRRSSITRK